MINVWDSRGLDAWNTRWRSIEGNTERWEPAKTKCGRRRVFVPGRAHGQTHRGTDAIEPMEEESVDCRTEGGRGRAEGGCLELQGGGIR